MADKPKKPHAIVIPYPLQGHVIPTVHLALKLASQGFTITFINAASIDHQISKAQHKTDVDFMATLLHVFSAHIEEVVAQIVASGQDVHFLIADTFFVWPSKIAKKFGLVQVSFWTEPALVFTLYYHLDLLRLNGHFACPDCREDTIDYISGVKGIEMKDTMSYLQETDTTSVCYQIIYSCFTDTKNADFVLCNTVQELEPDTISALQTKIPYYAIGPIFPNDFSKTILATSLWPESQCTQWLDKRPHGSVLYVSFGSYAHVTRSDLEQIANGLSLSQVSFVMMMPDPLPVGFQEEVADRAIIVPWCSQREVLAHPAIGGFLAHCGWNSILESVWCQVPLLLVDDWKIGINLSYRKVITKEEVSDNEFRNRVKEVKKTLGNAVSPTGSSEKNKVQFIKDLKAKIEKIDQAKNTKSNGHVQ
ncbi:hypothetical protein P3X46_009982 [Hevea brasiliensis]|uniref:Glycosyltransferase n=1 Tax=Hevea brasiliensis TaxID=3981 RepID=A0ABQ9MCP2_HEVBR|nr:hypothetical protein P3X46_009982 [Hevea brasiliensis]